MLVELGKVVGVTAAVLVLVTAFGAIIKPLAGDIPISVLQAVKYVGLSMVPMTQYALPFAAGFGATIVLHRMATDNEILAMATSGLPYHVILAPVLGMGAVLVLVMAVMVQYVIPWTYAVMGRVLAGDVTALLQYSVDQGRPVRFGEMEIWAESMRVLAEPEGTEADERIELRRMVAARLDEHGGINSDVTAAGAVLDLYEQDGVVLIRMAMDDAVSFDASASSLRGFPRIEPTRAIAVPMPERSEPMAMTRSELKAVDAHPERFPEIQRLRDQLVDALRVHRQREAVARTLKANGEVVLHSADANSSAWRIEAGGLRRGVLTPRTGGPVTMTELAEGDVATRRFTPESAVLTLQDAGLHGRDRRLVVEMTNVTVRDMLAGERDNHRASIEIGNLEPVVADETNLDAPLDALLDLAQDTRDDAPEVGAAHARIEHKVERLHGQVVSRLWRRWAVAATAGLLPVLGAVLALLMRSSQPLSIYIVAFLPALLNLVLITGGGAFMRQGDEVGGLLLMWSGNAVLASIIAAGWWRLARH